VSSAVRSIVAKLAEDQRWTPAEIAQAFEDILTGQTDPALIAAFLMGLRTRGESVDDIVAGARVMRKHVRPVVAPASAIDTCGTGGLSWTSLNTSTAVAFVAAGAGAVVAKHGNRSRTKAGSADVLEVLGVNLTPSDAQLQASFHEAGVAFMFAPGHHSAMKHVAPVRAAMGIRTIFNMLGPLANPAGVKRQVLGVFAPEWVEPFARSLLALGSERAMVVHGLDGLDEISVSGPTLISEVRDGAVRTYETTPEALGVDRISIEDLRGGTAAENAETLKSALRGEDIAFTQLVTLNAAAALIVAGLADNMGTGVRLVRAAIAQGRPMAALDALRLASNG
jgi:anthranilate phosphoribosyltransferase